MKRVTPKDISQTTRQLYITGNWFRRQMIYWRPFICPFEELICRVPAGSSVLDVGCGDGLFLNALACMDRGISGCGFDTNEVAIKSAIAAKENSAKLQGIQFMSWALGRPWPGGKFDVVSMIDVLHHIPVLEKQNAIFEATEHIKPGGLLLFKDIGHKPKWRAFFNSLHDLVLTGERVSYVPLNTVAAWVSAAGLRELERKTINRLWYGHELAVFTKESR